MDFSYTAQTQVAYCEIKTYIDELGMLGFLFFFLFLVITHTPIQLLNLLH